MFLRVCMLLFVVGFFKRDAAGTELTFELEDNARQCFHEDIKKDTKCTLEYQVSIIA